MLKLESSSLMGEIGQLTWHQNYAEQPRFGVEMLNLESSSLMAEIGQSTWHQNYEDQECEMMQGLIEIDIYVSRFGDSTQAAKSIAFNSAENFDGTSRTIIAWTEQLQLRYGSYFHTGNHSWTVYEGANFDGNSRCITADAIVKQRGYGVTYVANEVGTIGSIREGCWSTVTDPTTSGTTSVTTTTLVPDTFDCSNRTDGIYPHPSSCAMFAFCEEGTSSSFRCPEPLLFHPIELRCTLAEWVVCELQCSGRPDGVYQHPKECASFLICRHGYTQVFSVLSRFCLIQWS
ncbi:putative endochitinase [Folsomia candida]|uniref:Putative endochitinase n=1 Tax=Folsomia candida TaxID=158441 RepID=A0A226DBH9_FOLCA|nr:putative endochitinase [Folsomia candida]